MVDEWADVRLYPSDTERTSAPADWLQIHNYHRNHTAIGGPPVTRVTNIARQHA